MSNADAERSAYLARVRARMIAVRDGAPPPPDAKPVAMAVVEPAPEPQAVVEPLPVSGGNHMAEELGALACELSHDSLEVLVLVGRRLARCEEGVRT